MAEWSWRRRSSVIQQQFVRAGLILAEAHSG